MKVYIKRGRDFSVADAADCESWSLPLEAVESESGTAVLTNYGSGDFDGDWLYIHNKILLITQTNPDKGRLTITTADPISAFDRACFWPETTPNSYGAFIKGALERDYRDCADNLFALPYLRVTSTDTTPIEIPELDDTRLYALNEVMAQARKKGVIIDFSLGKTQRMGDTLDISIHTANGKTHKITFSDGHHQLVSENYSPNAWSRITVLQEQERAEDADADAPTEYLSFDFYLSADNEISSTPPAKRAEGKWTTLTCSSDEEPLEVAKTEFLENLRSHKIEFDADRLYGLYDRVLLRLTNRLLESQITYVGASSKDSRYHYKCGELPVTLTDKVKAASSSGTATTVVKGGGEKGAPGEAGPQGPQGPQGERGPAGPQGPQGAKGDTGAAGPQGAKGDKGDKGDTGATGATGPQGAKGDTGATGPAGPAGPQGLKGDTGATGAQGAQGVRGPKGDTGERGPQGESGVAVETNGFYYLSVDAAGNLWAYTSDGAPNLEYDSASGNLYAVTEVT